MFNPVTLDQKQLSGDDSGNALLDLHAPIMDLGHIGGNTDDETRMLLDKVNARRVVQAEYAIHNFEQEPLLGYVVRLQLGQLGLVKA
jgi:hypothetical protein